MNGTETRTTTTPHFTFVTSAGPAVDHLVSDTAMTDGLSSGGWFLGLCGTRFAAAAMCAEPGYECGTCRKVLAALHVLSTAEQRMTRHHRHARLGLLASLKSFFSSHAAPESRRASESMTSGGARP